MGETELRELMELLFFGYRDFTAGPDKILADYGFGRAHHRVVYFVGRDPGLSVSELLKILNITKQSLARVLGQLIEEGFIQQTADEKDRRRRLLTLTNKGQELDQALRARQGEALNRAILAAGPEALLGFRSVLRHIINEEDRLRFDKA
ncbi:MAG: MarR family winged helix-turn-helix transcriptional regulator [Magnetovibrionaceae bacterium]